MSMVDTVYVMSGGESSRRHLMAWPRLSAHPHGTPVSYSGILLRDGTLFCLYPGYDPKEVLKFIAVFILITSVLLFRNVPCISSI